MSQTGAPPHIVIDDADHPREVTDLVDWTQGVLLKHPIAAQAAYHALVAEGRRFAVTDEGRAWRARLEASPGVGRLRALWEAATFNALESDGSGVLPGLLIDLVAQAISRVDLESLTAGLSEAGAALDRR